MRKKNLERHKSDILNEDGSVKERKCKCCRKYKTREEFKSVKGAIGGISSTCSKCFYERHKHKQLAIKKIKYAENPKPFLDAAKKWRKENPERFKIITKRSRSRPEVKAYRNLRKRLQKILKNESGNYSSAVGCSPKELKKYLESKFLKNMSWDNYGEWEVDHIKPIHLFAKDDATETKSANHHTNLQPLWKDHNNAKLWYYDEDHPMGWRGLNDLLSPEDKQSLGERFGWDLS